MKNRLITPEGMKDFLFEECESRNFVEKSLMTQYKSGGFSQVVTPSIEFLDVFGSEKGYMDIDKMFKFQDKEGRLVAMRPDSTLPIARLASTRLKNQTLPLRLCYTQKMYLAKTAHKGKNNEVVQSGVEIIGNNSKRSDLEVIFASAKALESCKVQDFTIEIGHIGIFTILVEKLGVSLALKEQLRSLIENKNYPALGDTLEQIGASKECEMLKQLPRLFGGEEVFEKARKLFQSEEINEVLKYLQDIYKDLVFAGLEGKISVDLGMVNRTDYYSGIIFRGYIEGHGDAVIYGGRYDNLLKDFGADLPAIGFAIDVDAVANHILCKYGSKQTPADILVHAEDGSEMKAVFECSKLQEEGFVVENSLEDSLEYAIKYAKAKNIAMIHVVGKDTQVIKVGTL